MAVHLRNIRAHFPNFFRVQSGQCALVRGYSRSVLGFGVGKSVGFFVSRLVGVTLYPFPVDVVCGGNPLVDGAALVCEF